MQIAMALVRAPRLTPAMCLVRTRLSTYRNGRVVGTADAGSAVDEASGAPTDDSAVKPFKNAATTASWDGSVARKSGQAHPPGPASNA